MDTWLPVRRLESHRSVRAESEVLTKQNKRYALFGYTLESDFRFESHLARATGAPDLSFNCSSEAPLVVDWQGLAPVYQSPAKTPEAESLAELYRVGDCEILRFVRVADFYLWPRRIICHLLDPAHSYLVEIRFLGPVMAYWLERQGLVALHASAVAFEDRAVVFLSGNKGGKTSLAAAMLNLGHKLLTDDILAIEETNDVLSGRPGYPQMRMWPPLAAHFLGNFESLGVIHPSYSKRRVPIGNRGFGQFHDVSRPLGCIYLPQRRSEGSSRLDIEINPVPRRESVIELIRHSFSPNIVEATGMQPQRLSFLSRLVQRVPVRSLVYPEGLARLPAVCEALSRDRPRMSSD